MFGQKKAYEKGYKDGHEDGYAVGNKVARYLSTKKEGDGRAQGLYDKIHPDSIMADVDRYLKQEEDS